MNRNNVRLIFLREVRDQLRDRRTLFMITILPVLLYPMLGLGVVQIMLTFSEQPRTVVILNAEDLPQTPALLLSDGIQTDWFSGGKADSGRLRILTDAKSTSASEARSAPQQRSAADGDSDTESSQAESSAAESPTAESSTADAAGADSSKNTGTTESADSHAAKPSRRSGRLTDEELLANARGLADTIQKHLTASSSSENADNSTPSAGSAVRHQLGQIQDRISDQFIESGLQVLVIVPPGYAESIESLQTAATVDTNEPSAESPPLIVVRNSADDKSAVAFARVQDALNHWQDALRAETFARAKLRPELQNPARLQWVETARGEEVAANVWSKLFPAMIVIMTLTGAFYPAIDLGAGEKERGTMETLLCSPVNRINIVLGKFLLVLTASAATVALAIAMMGLSAFLAPIVLGGGGGAAAAAAAAKSATPMLIDPLGLVGVFAMVIPVAVLFAAVELTVALFAKSFKEAQSYVSPMMILVFLPAMMGMLPGVELSVKTALIPIMNISLVCKEMLSGVWNWSYIALIFGSSAFYAAIALAVCVRMFKREDVIFRA
ncbi:MAG: ABC transporter permease subunit [Cephaloticoccus sp.]|nr:ABC transporter permease subunit [Cephaloticoccus sp.]